MSDARRLALRTNSTVMPRKCILMSMPVSTCLLFLPRELLHEVGTGFLFFHKKNMATRKKIWPALGIDDGDCERLEIRFPRVRHENLHNFGKTLDQNGSI